MRPASPKGTRRSFTSAFVVALLTLVATRGVFGGCPPTRPRLYSICSYTVCTPQECAARGLECCPKPCGGSWCVKGFGPPDDNTICPPQLSSSKGCPASRSNATCEELKCTKKGLICCSNRCMENYCYQVPANEGSI